MGLFNLVGPLFGLPFLTGSLPHSPQFVRALQLAPGVLGLIPRAAINGVLIYVGMEGILSTSLWSRVCLLISPRASFPQRLAALGVPRVHLFTSLQLGLLGGCWLINLSPLGLCV